MRQRPDAGRTSTSLAPRRSVFLLVLLFAEQIEQSVFERFAGGAFDQVLDEFFAQRDLRALPRAFEFDRNEQVGIDEVFSQVLPNEKADIIKELQKKGHNVAMVGDGVNDAPSLASSDVGIAMGTGTDVAIESAGITLLGGNLSRLPVAIRLSHLTFRVIKQNLFWAFAYNVIGIPIAAGILYPLYGIMLNPAIAGAAMAFSSVSVVTNSLRLKYVKL